MATLRQTIQGGRTSQNFATAFAGRAGLAASLSSCACCGRPLRDREVAATVNTKLMPLHWCGQCANGQGTLNIKTEVTL